MNENNILINRLDDYISKALKTDRPVYTDFLNPAQQSLYIDILDKSKDVVYFAFGGHERCERRVFCISSVFSDIVPEFGNIKVIKIDFDKFNKKWITHRSILGAILGLGNDRRMVGDILIKELSAYVFLFDTTAEFVGQSLVSVGGANVSTTVLKTTDLDFEYEQGAIKKATVPSLRLDSVLSAGLNLSRGKAAELVASDLVFVNWKQRSKANFVLKENDVISIRKRGRIVLKSIGKQSAKGRTWIELECFL